jgi:hypothetical protein
MQYCLNHILSYVPKSIYFILYVEKNWNKHGKNFLDQAAWKYLVTTHKNQSSVQTHLIYT